jgi:predicted aldo/keto reductase-like oxidoreductase
MQHRQYADTDIEISALGFGAMRLPDEDDFAIECMVHAFENGVNFIDTAPGYRGGEDREAGSSERLVGRALQQVDRDGIYLSTKNATGVPSAEGWREGLEQSLENLQTDYIDFYQCVHGMKWETFQEKFEPLALEEAEKARDEGLIRHFSFSSHDSPENILKLLETGLFESCIIQYNLLDRRNEPVINYAREHDISVLVMGPVGGGRLGMRSEKMESIVPGVQSTPELALRFVLSNPGVTSALSGMNTIDMIDENIATASIEEPLSDEELAAIEQTLEENKRLSELYCTGCDYCMPCPQDVGISRIFSAMNMHRVWGLTEPAKERYARLGPDSRSGLLQADACVECGSCEAQCPQDIPIIEQLKESHEALSE